MNNAQIKTYQEELIECLLYDPKIIELMDHKKLTIDVDSKKLSTGGKNVYPCVSDFTFIEGSEDELCILLKQFEKPVKFRTDDNFGYETSRITVKETAATMGCFFNCLLLQHAIVTKYKFLKHEMVVVDCKNKKFVGYSKFGLSGWLFPKKIFMLLAIKEVVKRPVV